MKGDRIIVSMLMLLTLGGLGASLSDEAHPVRIAECGPERIVMEFICPQARLESVTVNGERYDSVSLQGAELSAEEGRPDLPQFGSMVAIPPNSVYSISYELSEPQIFEDVKPLPVRDASRSLMLSPDYYESAPYPSRQVIAGEAVYLRDFRVLPLQTCPFSWEPSTNTLTRYGHIRINIDLSYPKGDSGSIPYTGYSYAFKNLYEARIQNFSAYRDLESGPQNARVLIIHGHNTDPVFISKLDEFVTWKRQKGFIVSVASTQVAGTTNSAIKSYIQAQYDDPGTRPDFIILVGDVAGSCAVPTFFETESEFNAEGDYPYTYLSGDDMLGDAFIGRLSAEDVSQLLTLYNKVYTYEKTVNINPPASDWMNRMLVIGDPTTSGISCAYTARFIKEIAQRANPDYSFVENYTSGFVSTINSGLNQGVGFFAYRGYAGVSGWSPSTSVVNGFKLPHAVILTCQTGSFAGTSLSEQIIRMGTESVPAGAATCIAMASPGTHTSFNNALISGIMSGVFCHGMRTMGEALLNGRLYLHEIYGATQPAFVRSLAHWCNLMGDPTLETWVGVAGELNIEVQAPLPEGLSILEVVVRDSLQLPVEGVSVTAWSPSQNAVVASAFTMANGIAVLELPASPGPELLITAAKHNFKPCQQTLSVDSTGSLVYAAHQVIDDGSLGSSGNANGTVNASETIALNVQIKNTTASELSSLSAVLSIDHPGIQITQGTATYPVLGPGMTGYGSQPFILSINSSISPLETVRCLVSVTDDEANVYQSVFYLRASNSRLSISGWTVNEPGNGVLDPGEECSLNLELSNTADYPAPDLFGELHSLNSLLAVSDSIAYFGTVTGQSQTVSVDGFQVKASSDLVAGMQLPMWVRFYNSAGFEQTCLFNLSVGTVSQTTPLGPDEYGYLIYDETDTDYPDCPVYDWVEIVPSLGGRGTLIPNLGDTGAGTSEGETTTATVLKELMLPFAFRFYGIDYDRITVCVNGFIALGSTNNGEFRNARLPGGQGPCPMIAAFWDDLTLPLSAGLYQYYDEAGHCFIIQYNHLENGYDDSSDATFQVIFYDPVYHHSGLGDGIIKLQYKTFNNIDAGGTAGYYDTPLHGNFCTVGIKDHTNTRGLEYTFNNTYPQAAAPLANEKALLITTVPVHHQTALLGVDEMNMLDGNNLIPEPGEDIEIGLTLRNLGLGTANSITASLSCQSPYASVTASQSAYPDIAGSGAAVNLSPFVVSVSDSCPNSAVLSFICEINYGGSSQTFPLSLTVRRPAVEFGGYLINDADGDGNGILEPGDSAAFVVNFKNTGYIEARNFVATLACSNPLISLLDTHIQIASVPPGTTAQASFRFTLSSSAALGSNVNVNLSYGCDLMTGLTSQIQARIGSSGLYDDFESSFGSYVSIPSSSAWQWGTDQTAGAHSGSKVWGTALNQQYPNDVTWKLSSPSIYIGPHNYLDYWQCYDTQSGCDGGQLEIYAGGTWTLLTPVGGYPTANVAALNGPGFSGSSAWSPVRCDLSPYANGNVRFRWTFASDGSVQGQGWYIDDVRTIGFTNLGCKLSGSIALDGPLPDLSEVWIGKAAGINVNPLPDWSYTLYLPIGIHSVSCSAPGYSIDTAIDLDFSLDTPSLQHDFVVHELKPVTDLTSSHTASVLTLHWEAPSEPYFPVTGYKVVRKINAGAFETAVVTSEPVYTELMEVPGQYRYYIVALYDEGESLPSELLSIGYPFPDEPPIPLITRLFANYPNPFNPSTTISFDLAAPQTAALRIYNLRGQLVNTLCDSELSAGSYSYIWDGRDAGRSRVASGVYFYRLSTASHTETRKMLLLK